MEDQDQAKKDKFRFASIKERIVLYEYLKRNKYVNVSETVYSPIDSFISWDATFLSANTNVVTEVKVRPYIAFYYDKWIFEEKKMKLLNIANENNYFKIFICAFTDYVALWEIRDDFKFIEMLLPENSADNGDLILKSVTLLSLSDAMEVTPLETNTNELNKKAKSKFNKIYGRDFEVPNG